MEIVLEWGRFCAVFGEPRDSGGRTPGAGDALHTAAGVLEDGARIVKPVTDVIRALGGG
jgi:hypothetical protein